jgi:hypothetical protein
MYELAHPNAEYIALVHEQIKQQPGYDDAIKELFQQALDNQADEIACWEKLDAVKAKMGIACFGAF